jgi:hypothetical protein
MSVASIGQLQLDCETAGAREPLVLLRGALMTSGLLAGYQRGLAGQSQVIAAARLAIVPATTHTGLCDRAAWVVPVIADFLGG